MQQPKSSFENTIKDQMLNSASEKQNLSGFPDFKITIRKDYLNVKLFDAIQNSQKKLKKIIPIEKCIEKFNDSNLSLLNQKDSETNIKLGNDILANLDMTPEYKQNNYKKQVFYILSNLKKSNKAVELPKLPYGKALSDDEFIRLLEECVEYSNYHLEENTLNKMKKKLIKDNYFVINDLFSNNQIKKDIIQNALLTILTTDNKKDQQDNFNLLEIGNVSSTPLIKMEFGKDDKNKLDINELKEIFCSPVYLENFQKTLKDFIPESNKKNVQLGDLKKYINKYFDNHYIYFCDLPENIMAVTVHTGNIYLKSKYLYEYYNEKFREFKTYYKGKNHSQFRTRIGSCTSQRN